MERGNEDRMKKIGKDLNYKEASRKEEWQNTRKNNV